VPGRGGVAWCPAGMPTCEPATAGGALAVAKLVCVAVYGRVFGPGPARARARLTLRNRPSAPAELHSPVLVAGSKG
jgi:hypothetical protein